MHRHTHTHTMCALISWLYAKPSYPLCVPSRAHGTHTSMRWPSFSKQTIPSTFHTKCIEMHFSRISNRILMYFRAASKRSNARPSIKTNIHTWNLMNIYNMWLANASVQISVENGTLRSNVKLFRRFLSFEDRFWSI